MHVTGNGWIGQERIERIPIRRNEVSQDSTGCATSCLLGASGFTSQFLLSSVADTGRERAVREPFLRQGPAYAPSLPAPMVMRGGAAVGVAEVEGKALRGARFESRSSLVVQLKSSA